jgi:hypothetical protein
MVQGAVDAGAPDRAHDNRPRKCWMELTLGDTKVVRTRESVWLTPH